MRDSEQAKQIRLLVESLLADQAERERLKREADEALVQFRLAVREFIGESRRMRRQLRD